MDDMVKDYLMKKDEDYWRGFRDMRDKSAEASAKNTFASSLANSAAQIGSLNGKMASAQPVESMAKNLNSLSESDVSNQGILAKSAIDRDQMKAKLYSEIENRRLAREAAEQSKNDSMAFRSSEAEKSRLASAEQKALDRTAAEERARIMAANAKERAQVMAGTADGAGRRLKPNELSKAGEGRDIVSMLEDLGTNIENHSASMGPFVGRWKSANPYDTEGQVFAADVKAKAQTIGRYLEGGVLRAEDIPKYEAMLPNMKDTPEVARGKLETVKNLVAQRHNAELKALEQQGYDSSGLYPTSVATKEKKPTQGIEKKAYAAPASITPDVNEASKKFNLSPEEAAALKRLRGGQ